MNSQIFLLLAQDGLISGTIYALLAVAIVLVFTVTRVLFVPQGEFVALGALTLASLQSAKIPGTLWLLVAGAAVAMTLELVGAARNRSPTAALRALAAYGLLPALLGLLTWWAVPLQLALPLQVLLTLALVVPLGPILYRVAFQRLANASVLVLLIVSMAAQVVLSGLSLVFFGAEGSRTPAFSEEKYALGAATVSSGPALH
jgi:branched-chain amino acid transport system permease protein